MKVLSALSATLILFFSPLEVLGAGCFETMLNDVTAIEDALDSGDVTELSCSKVGNKGYSVVYRRECTTGGSRSVAVDVLPDGGIGYGTCVVNTSLTCQADLKRTNPDYASTSERNADKRDIATLCGMLPLDDAPVCQ